MTADKVHVLPGQEARGQVPSVQADPGWFRRLLIGTGERRTRLRTLTLIRWVAIVGQGFTILLVDLSFGFLTFP